MATITFQGPALALSNDGLEQVASELAVRVAAVKRYDIKTVFLSLNF